MLRDKTHDVAWETENGNKPDSEMLYKYWESEDKGCFCFIEGETDKEFYSKFLHRKIRETADNLKYICSGKNGGKESVIYVADILLKNSSLKPHSKSVFIVDRDYDDDIVKRNTIYDALTVLPCYSFENYYFSPELNLQSIFREIFDSATWKKRLNEFMEGFRILINDIALYCAWKLVCIMNYEKCKNLTYFHDDIVQEEMDRIEFKKPFKIPKKISDFTNNALKEIEEKYPSLYEKIEKQSKRIKDDVRMIKGKLLFAFLVGYLKHQEEFRKNNSQLKGSLYQLGEKMEVDLDLKQVDIHYLVKR